VPAPIAWSRRAADELWSGVVTPLTFSVLAEPMAEHMVRSRLRNAGFAATSRQPVFRLIRGHVYVNASLLHDVMRELPTMLLSDGVLALLPEALRADLAESTRAPWDPRTLATVLRLTWNERSWAPWSRAALFRAEAARVRAELEGFEVPSGAAGREIAKELAAVRARLGRFLDVVSWAMIYAYLFFHLGTHLSRDWLPGDEALSALAAGVPGVRTFEVHAELSALARRVRDDPALRCRVLEGSARTVLAAARREEIGAFGTDLLELAHRHGHRLVARDLSFPTWRERPEVLVEMIRKLAVSPPATPRRAPPDVLAGARAQVSRGALGALRWRLFEGGLGWCREYYAARENMRYHADYFLAAFRALALAGGERLAAAGSLSSADDVFYLTLEELDAALARVGADADLARAAGGRRREYQAYAASVPEEVVWGEERGGQRRVPPAPAVPSSTLRATAASPGVVEGTARVVRSVEEIDAVQPGDVIVATATDPTWTSYLSLASGLVLEVGGLLSHGAIIARELGIPAVVDLAGATEELRSGQRLRVNGSTGVVERLARIRDESGLASPDEA